MQARVPQFTQHFRSGLLLALAGLLLVSTAYASCLSMASEATCTGHNPDVEGCTAFREHIGEVSLLDEQHRQIGSVSHFYAAACQSTWAVTRVGAETGAMPIYATVFVSRPNGTGESLGTGYVAPSVQDGFLLLTSPMIYLPVGTTYAAGDARVQSGRYAVSRTPTVTVP